MAPEAAPPQDIASETRPATAAYILSWLTGVIVLLKVPRTASFARWHAIHSIGIGLTTVLLANVANYVSLVILIVSGPILPGHGTTNPLLSLGAFVVLGAIVVHIACAVTAHGGERLRVPGLAAIADRYA